MTEQFSQGFERPKHFNCKCCLLAGLSNNLCTHTKQEIKKVDRTESVYKGFAIDSPPMQNVYGFGSLHMLVGVCFIGQQFMKGASCWVAKKALLYTYLCVAMATISHSLRW